MKHVGPNTTTVTPLLSRMKRHVGACAVHCLKPAGAILGLATRTVPGTNRQRYTAQSRTPSWDRRQKAWRLHQSLKPYTVHDLLSHVDLHGDICLSIWVLCALRLGERTICPCDSASILSVPCLFRFKAIILSCLSSGTVLYLSNYLVLLMTDYLECLQTSDYMPPSLQDYTVHYNTMKISSCTISQGLQVYSQFH